MHRQPALGYTMVALAATLFAINGTVSKVILGSGIDSQRLTEVRCAGAMIGLLAIARGLVLIVELWESHRPDAAGLAAAVFLWMVVLGTIVPFVLVVAALQWTAPPGRASPQCSSRCWRS
jgi:drug/metabolite transporter (DMT)-like permease